MRTTGDGFPSLLRLVTATRTVPHGHFATKKGECSAHPFTDFINY